MPITYTVSENGGVLVKGKDVVSGSEIKDINNAIYESREKILNIKYQLWDTTDVSEFLLSNGDIEDFARQDAAAAKINPNMIIAVVASNDLVFGLGRMWEAHSSNSPFQSMVFRNIEEAERWIDEMMGKP